MLIAQALLMAFGDMGIMRFPIDAKPFPLPDVSDDQWKNFAPLHFEWNLIADKMNKPFRVKIPRKMKKALKSYDKNKDCRKTKRVMRIIRIENNVLKKLEL